MTVNELKKLCDESLSLYFDIKIEIKKLAERRVVLFKTAERNLIYKKEKLEKLEKKLKEYSFVFETNIKTLKDAIWEEILNNKNIYLAIVSKSQNKEIIKQDNILINTGKNNIYELQLNKGFIVLPILEFESCEDAVSCEKTKINLLEEGFIKSGIYVKNTEELERNIPGFKCLMWGIVENNLKNLYVNNETSKQED